MTTAPNEPVRTTIAVSAIAACAFSIADEYAADYLRDAERGGTKAGVRVPWSLPFPAPQHRVALTFGLHRDVTDGGREHDEIRFHWDSNSRLLPDFRGTLQFRIDGDRTRILLDGTYLAPLGALGRAFDFIAGRRIARASLQDVADRLAADLSEREQTWRRAHPTPAIAAAPSI
jgi:hypothetical protein